MAEDVASLCQGPLPPREKLPIVLIGAGGIAADAHLPAYRASDLAVRGVFDLDAGRAAALAKRFAVPQLERLGDVATLPVLYDVATPPAAHLAILDALPEGAAVLLQKPMGRTLDEASDILRLVRRRALRLALNFQLRSAPAVLALRDALSRGWLGKPHALEVQVSVRTPWHLFPFLAQEPRVEVPYHSIHYLDLVRCLLGEPLAVQARTLPFAGSGMAGTRTAIILDMPDDVRCVLSVDHHNAYEGAFQQAQVRCLGDEGAAILTMGALLDYPTGKPDALLIARGGGEPQPVALAGDWFLRAFANRMTSFQRFLCGDDDRLESDALDGWRTMALAEACCRAAVAAGTPIPTPPGDLA